ncbi:MAG: acyl transferase [Magnetovibrio sp.]|nr:acyl transferase [Magnetovibrio sp.]|tara:strand:- start:194 stop:850 length:657 start_codon:yes stop_codon:yes gene_type:complete
MIEFTSDRLKVLAKWDTPTICNALEIVMPERRGFGFTIDPFYCLDPSLPPIVGYARTAKLRAAQPASGSAEANRIPYYEYIAEGPKPGIGAFWGEVNTAVHKGLGALGVITNGSIRDLSDSAPGFQALGGHVGPSHAFVYPVDFNWPVTVHGMEVAYNDIIHADQHGAVLLPQDCISKIPEAVELVSRREEQVLKAARADDFNIEKLKKAINRSADIH